MSQSLTLELSEQVFAAIQLQAQAIGISPAQLATTLLERQFPQAFKLLLGDAEKNAALARFEHHFGTLALDDSTDLDNESIDANLAREYWADLLETLRQFRQKIPSDTLPIVNTEQSRKNQAAIDLLDSWLDDDEDASEHQQAWDFLKTALDEDRLSDRPLFP